MVTELVSVAPDGSGQQLGYVPLDKICNERSQVRRDWRHNEGHANLDQLTESIKEHGLLQPVEVSRRADGTYDILVGHRRLVAARRAGLCSIPAVVRQATDEERVVLQLAENVHRHNLSPVDEADAYACLMEKHGYTVSGVARLVGLSAHHVHARLRVRADAILSDALSRDLITKSVAASVTYLGDAYAQVLYRRLENGHRVTDEDIREMRACKERDGVYGAQRAQAVAQQDAVLNLLEQGYTFPAIARHLGLGRSQVRHLYDAGRARRPDWRVPTRAEVRAALKARKAREAHQLRAQGLTFEQIGERIGCSLSCAASYVKEPVPCEPNVTFNGVNLDPFIAKAQERAQAEHEAQPRAPDVPEPVPHSRPLRSPLPWENQDTPRLMYSVDPAGIVTGAPKHEESEPAATPLRCPPPPGPRRPAPMRAGDDPDLTRVRFMLEGAEQPCRDLLRSVLNLGREKGWTCHDLWRRVEAASR